MERTNLTITILMIEEITIASGRTPQNAIIEKKTVSTGVEHKFERITRNQALFPNFLPTYSKT